MSRFRPVVTTLIVLAVFLIPSGWSDAAGQPPAAPACRHFVETGRYLCEPFLGFWETNDGLAQFGLPITAPIEDPESVVDLSGTVQYFERQRLEFTSDDDGAMRPPTLGRLGVEVLESRGRQWRSFPTADPTRDDYFPETGHAIDPLFRDFWTGHGLDLGNPAVSLRESLALFGFPISELMIETNSSLDRVVVQWYERARLEYHPDYPPGSRVQLGRLGVELGVVEPAPSVRLELVADGLTAPVALVEPPDDSGLRFIVDQIGLVRVLNPDGVLLDQAFLDLRDRMVLPSPGYDERGLLGLAFHPEYATNSKLYVHYSAPLRSGAPEGWNHTSHISEFEVSPSSSAQVDPSSERVLLRIDQPHWAHNGGAIAFGPDGYLYIGLGDGGHGGDEGSGHVDDWYPTNNGGNGQDIEANLLGSILRIDVDGDGGYAIPPDNPFVDRPGLDEIWAYGFRNPFRFSFDAGGNGQLFVGDVGQDSWEEINIVEAGRNYGWNVREGSGCYYNVQPAPAIPCPASDPYGRPLIPPVMEFSNSGSAGGGPGRAVIGGYVYRGAEHQSMYGAYIFGSWSQDWNDPSGRIFLARHPPGVAGQWPFQPLEIAGNSTAVLDEYLLGFGQDRSGELYILTTGSLGPSGVSGKVYRLAR